MDLAKDCGKVVGLRERVCACAQRRVHRGNREKEMMNGKDNREREK
jgi:hypothetical protein